MNVSDAERDIIARLRGTASGASAGQIDTALQSPVSPRESGPSDVSVEVFLKKLEANGCTATAVASRSEAVLDIARVVSARQRERRVVVGADPRLAALPWRDGGVLPRFGTATADDRTSVSYAQAGIAETGSLVLWVDKRNPALNNLLAEQHVVLVDEADLHPHLEAIWDSQALYEADRRPRGIMVVSGPSSTADIAMQLVWGAHGPRGLHVIVLRRA
jgi:L-lactate dehydrogenase complex protein LldG